VVLFRVPARGPIRGVKAEQVFLFGVPARGPIRGVKAQQLFLFGVPMRCRVDIHVAVSAQAGAPVRGASSVTHLGEPGVQVYLFGGLVASWTQPRGDEVLYVRPDAVFNKSKPISGGIPHCFPQFGPGKLQQHGFARNVDWSIASTSADPQPDEKDPSVELVLTENEYTLAMWWGPPAMSTPWPCGGAPQE
jgi:Aldose 1-epimerase